MKPWPRLSETLPGPRSPSACQSCGVTNLTLNAWEECDDQDKPTGTMVMLCTPCAEKIIDPHPRLYSRHPLNEPMPGSMALCAACIHREGLKCTHPALKANGGPGLAIHQEAPIVAHVDGRDKKGRRFGKNIVIYPKPPTLCVGRTERSQ